MAVARYVLPLVFLVSLAVAGSPSIDVTGDYRSNWDDVRLVQRGDRVFGTYVCCGGGTIEGRITEKRVLRYRWQSPTGGDGMGVWTIDGARLDGTWGWKQSQNDGGRWDLVRKPPQIAQ
jgi:hypothetical protein